MSNGYVENRLMKWAMAEERKPHEPAWPKLSHNGRLVEEGPAAMVGSGNLIGDGGLSKALSHNRHEIQLGQDAAEIRRIANKLRRDCRPLYDVLQQTFLDRPGRKMPPGLAAHELGISRMTYWRRYRSMIRYIDESLIDCAA